MKTTLTQEVIWRLPIVHLRPSIAHQHIADDLSKTNIKSITKVIDKHINASTMTELNAFNKMAELTPNQYFIGLGKLVSSRENSLKCGDVPQADDQTLEIIVALAHGIASGRLPAELSSDASLDQQTLIDGLAIAQSLQAAIAANEVLTLHSSLEYAIDSFVSRSAAVYLNYYTKEDLIMSIWLIALDGRFKLSPFLNIPTPVKRQVDLTPLGSKLYRYLSL